MSAPPGPPVVVRLSLAKYLLSTRMPGAVVTALAVGMMLSAGIEVLSADGSAGDRTVFGLASLALAVFLIVLVPVSVKRQLKDGFAAYADHTGVYLRPPMGSARRNF